MRAITIVGGILGLFAILNGIYVASYPPVGDEPQGYAIIAIGIFIIIASLELGRRSEDSGDVFPAP